MNALPERFGEYLLVKRLSESLMAEVFVAVRLGDRNGKTVVLKRPRLGERASGESAQAILREAEVLSAVRSPTLVTLEAQGEVAGLPFVAVEHVRGLSLDRLLARRGAMSRGAALAVGRDLYRALAALHAAGWVHADVAPSNVVVDDAGEAKLIDLGIAMHAGEARHVVAGKPGYVAPEVPGQRAAAPAEDVYAAALVVAECLGGRRLFDERDVAEAATRGDARPLVAKLSAGDLLMPALASAPGERISASDIALSLTEEPSARADLAALVSAELAAPDDPATERSAPLSVARHTAEIVVSRTQASAPLAFPSPIEVATGHTTRSSPDLISRDARDETHRPTSSRSILLVAGAVVLALVVGFLSGRRVTRPREASIQLPVVTPRSEVFLDGHTLIVTDPNRPIPISPGTHTLSLSVRKREKEIEFNVREGENVVFVPLLVPKNASPDPSTDRPR